MTAANVCCFVCRKSKAAVVVKDCGFKTYPACKTCADFMLTAKTAVVVGK